jgi:SAM-dependent methyltransferase
LYPANFDEKKLDDFAFASRKLPELMHLNLVGCPVCQLSYASPALTGSFLASAYREAAYDSTVEADYAAATYATRLPEIISRLGTIGRALEIGSGNGAFLEYLKQAGFTDVVGIEPSKSAADRARVDLRPLIKLGMFEANDFAPGSLSLLTCFQTIEHVENPLQLCRDAWRLLRPGGAIYLIGHDRESFVNRVLGTRSPIFDIEHLQLFSRYSMRYMLKAAGFNSIGITSIRNRYPLLYWLRLSPLPGPLKKAMIGMLEGSAAGKMTFAVDVGNLVAIGYKPLSEGTV